MGAGATCWIGTAAGGWHGYEWQLSNLTGCPPLQRYVHASLPSCGKKEVGGSLASGAASVRPGGPRPQAGPMTDQGQELVVKTSSPAAGI